MSALNIAETKALQEAQAAIESVLRNGYSPDSSDEKIKPDYRAANSHLGRQL
jgi:hypothetical protein